MGQISNEKKTFLLPGIAYSIMEVFYNDSFNMIYVKEKSEQEMKYRIELYDLGKWSQSKKLSKDEKIEYRKKKKELRDKIKDQD